MKHYRNQIGFLLIVASFFLSPVFWTTFGCGGSTVKQRTAGGSTIDITGTVSVPTTTVSSLISALGMRELKQATTDSAGSGLTCTAFTLEGDNLGEATSDAAGTFTLAAGIDSLKPTDATTTSWTARFYIQCTDAEEKYDLRNYCEASVDETSTTSISCSADPDTTLTTFDLLSKSGCQIGASCSMSGVDPLCFMQVQQKAYQEASTASGTGVQDDLGAVKEVLRLCMAAIKPTALGFNSPEVMIGAIQSGTLTSLQLSQCGASSTQKEKYATGATAAGHLKDIFYSNIAGGSGISATLALEMKGITESETGSACDLAKGDPVYAQKLVATYEAAEDPTELETMKNTAHLDKTILGTMNQYCTNNVCDFTKYQPVVVVGVLAGAGMDPRAAGLLDANGNLQNLDKFLATINAADVAGLGTDFAKLRDLGISCGDAFVEQGIGTVAGSSDVINRTLQLFGASIGSQGAAYDPTKAGNLFETNLAALTASGTSAVDTCLRTATTDAQRLVCYAAGGFASYHIYISNKDSNNVSAFTINATTGVLTSVAGSPFSVGSGPAKVTVDPAGKFAYVPNNPSNNVSAFTINATTGVLTAISGSPFSVGSGPMKVTVDPTGKFAYVPNNFSNNVSAFTINATTGVLTPVAGSPFAAGTGPRAVTVDPTGKFAYVPNWGSNNVSAFAIDATTGVLTEVAGSPFSVGMGSQPVTVDPTGKFAYVSSSGSSSVSAFTINTTTGALTPVAGSPFAVGMDSRAVTVDPTGKFAYVPNRDSNTVSAFKINATTGVLAEVSGSPFSAGTMPWGVTVDPAGKFAYVSNNGSGSVSAFTINATTGALTAITGFPFLLGGGAAGPGPVAVDPTGKFAYVVGQSLNNVSAFTINATTGVLTAVSGSPFAVGGTVGMSSSAEIEMVAATQ